MPCGPPSPEMRSEGLLLQPESVHFITEPPWFVQYAEVASVAIDQGWVCPAASTVGVPQPATEHLRTCPSSLTQYAAPPATLIPFGPTLGPAACVARIVGVPPQPPRAQYATWPSPQAVQ